MELFLQIVAFAGSYGFGPPAIVVCNSAGTALDGVTGPDRKKIALPKITRSNMKKPSV